MQFRTLLLLALSMIFGSAHGMMLPWQLRPKPKPLGPKIPIIIFDESNNKTGLTAIEVTVKQGDRQGRRTIYHQENTKTVILPNSHTKTIAPEPFCKEVSTLCDDNDIPNPVIPCDNKKLYGTGSSQICCATNQMFFDPQYTRQQSHPFLRTLVGHEAMHQVIYEHFKKRTSADGEPLLKRAQTIKIGFHLLEKEYNKLQREAVDIDMQLQNNTTHSAYIKLTQRREEITQQSNAMLDVARQVAPHLHVEELECDQGPLNFFGKTARGKADLAQEGIDCFKCDMEREKIYMPYLDQNKLIDFPSSHPSHKTRIAQLEQEKAKWEFIAMMQDRYQ